MNAGTGTSVPHILILEDDAAHRDLILRAFRDDPDKFRLTVAETLRASREILEADRPDLILADWILPDGKGLEILPRTDGLVTVPLIVMTSFGDERLAVEIMKSGAIDYVVKSPTAFRDMPHIARRALSDWENIRERKRAEAAVQDSQKRLADILNFLPDAVLAIDNEGRVIGWNHAIERMTGVMASDMLGKGDHEHSIPFYGVRRSILIDLVLMDNVEIEKKYDYIQREDGRITSETFIPTLSGGKGAYLWGTAAPLFDSSGMRIGAIEVIRDITDRKRAEQHLQNREATIETLLNAPSDTIALLDRHGIIISMNMEGARRLGGTVQSVTGKSAYALLPPDVAKSRKEHIDQVFRTGRPEKFDDFRSGMYLHNEVYPVFNQERTTVDHIAIFARDITEIRQAELALQESEKKYRFLVDNVRDVIWQTTPDLTFTYISPAAETLTGYSPEDLSGTSLYSILTEPSARVVQQRLRERMENYARGSRDLATVFEAEIRKKDGGVRWFEISSNAVYGPEGTITGFQGISRDITERKRAEDALQESETKYRALVENSGTGIVIMDREGTYLFVNSRAAANMGAPPGAIVGKTVFDFLPEATAKEYLARNRETMDSGTGLEYEDTFELKTGKKSFFIIDQCLEDSAGRCIALQSSSVDITERKQAEERLRESRQILEGILNSIPVRVFWKDKNLTYLGCNTAFAQDAGFEKAEDIVGKDDYAMVWREQAELYREDDRAVIESGNAKLLIEEPQTTPAGDTQHLLTSKIPLCDTRGEVIGVLGTYLDITDRKLAEEMLRESEIRFRDLFNNMSTGVVVYNPTSNGQDFIIRDVNRAVETIEQVKKEEIVGKSVLEVFPGVMEFGLFAVFQRVAATGIAESHPLSMYRDNRIAGWRENYVYKLPSGEIVAIYEDLTEKKQAEEALQDSEERYRTLLNSAGIGVGYWSTDGTLLYLNDISYKRLKGTGADFIGRNMRELFLDKADLYLDRITRSAASEDPVEYEDFVRLPAGDGWYLSVYTRITRPDGTVAGVQVISMDITPRKQAEQIRKAYEARLDSAMEIGSLAWWEMDLPEGMVRFDDRKAAMLGYPPAQFTHYTDFTVLLHPEDSGPAMQAMKDHLEDRQSRYHIDYRIRTAAGDYRWFRDVGGITRYHTDGSPATVTGIVIDITASRQAEEALRTTETRYRALIQNSSDIIRILNRDGLIIYESESSDRILGYPKGYLIGKNPMEYIHPDDLERVKNDIQEVLDRKNPGIPTEFRIRKADGEYLWVDSIATNLLDVPGVNGIVITTRPIQQRKKAEMALLENQARLANAMDIAGLVNWEFDVASNMFTFDDRFYALYETTADREGGNRMPAEKYLQEFVYPEDRPYVLSEIRNLLATTDPGYVGQMEHRITPRDGSVRTIIARFAPVMGPEGKVIRTYGANQDITDFKLMESEIRSLNTVLEQRVRDRTEALAKTNEVLEEEVLQRQEAEKKLKGSFDEKVMLLKEIHHRVKNNLQIIASLLNLQSRYITDEKTLAAIRESQNRVKAMALVHEKLYRSEDISHVSLYDYVRFLGTGLFQFYDAKLRGIQFRLEIQDVNVDIDSAIPLGLILNELISNSLKYAFPDGRKGEITISVKKEEHILTVLYRDTGIGIPGDFDWRDTQSLGLRLVNTLVDQLNGTVELDRTSGTLFTMVLHEKEPRGPS